MNRRRKATRVAILSGTPVLLLILTMGVASAHGSMRSPVSRSYACFLEGPESPDSAACRAAIAAGGTQALYDWHEVNIGDAAGRHRSIIPDGQLCSAGREKYRGLDLARADWPATNLSAGSSHTFLYAATAPHRGHFELYVTRNGYDPTRPLRWADLERFATITDPPLSNGAYVMNARLPGGRSGRHMVYSIWQRSDSPEAFYTCSDVVFGGGGGGGTPPPAPAPTPAPGPTPAPAPTPAPTAPPPGVPGAGTTWQPNTTYATGARVTYAGRSYVCRQSHTSLIGWEPPIVPALWLST